MPHDTPLIATIVAGLGLAFVFGTIAQRLKIPPLVGYLLAGVAVGPFTPGYVADQALATELAELGIILLMFGVGLHFSLKELLSVKTIAIPGAIVQIAVATLMGLGLAMLMKWKVSEGLVFGLALSVASTVVLLRALQERRLMETGRGRIAVGWLIVEDLAMVLALVLIPTFANLQTGNVTTAASLLGAHFELGLGGVLLLTAVKVALFIALMLVVGRRLIPWILHYIAHTGSRELFRLAVLAIALGVAFGSTKLFDVSLALGAFFAGMMLRESPLSARAAQESLPLRDAFAVLFFVSVGMLFDPAILVTEPGKVLAIMSILILGTPIVAMALVLSFRYPLTSALVVGVSLAQIGEFSFILVALGLSLELLPAEAQSLVVAAAILTISLNPLLFSALRPAHAWLTKHSAWARRLESGPDALAELPMSTAERFLSGHVVVVGYGRVGRIIAKALDENGVPYVVAEENRERVAELRRRDIAAVSGDASVPAVLVQAHIAKASMLIIATPDTVSVRRMAEIARTLNPAIEIVVRTHNEQEASLLEKERVGTVFYGERELASAMTRHVLARRGIELR
jgi:K+:H+ antiporter